MRTMLVIGSAPCLYDDVKRALELRPFAEGILLNGACAALEWPGHLLFNHEEKTDEFLRARLEAFPGKPLPRIHATYYRLTGGKTAETRVEEARQMYPAVTDWWPAEVGFHAGAAGKGINIARRLGFDEAILCGCPMDGSGYFPGEGKGIRQSMNCLRIGDGGKARGYPKPGTGGREWMDVQETKIVRGYREHFAKLAQNEFKNGVYSMSGFTRDTVGEPPRGT
jgi:hypothetical protein